MNAKIEAAGSGIVLRELALTRGASRVLTACANVRSLAWDLALRDPVAESVFTRLGGDSRAFTAPELRGTAFRALVLDRMASDFFLRHSDGFGVGVWPCLGTRAHRLDRHRWTDVDPPDVADLRRYLLPARRGWLQLAAAETDPNWMDAVCGNGNRKLLFVLDESVLPLSRAHATFFLDEISRRARAGSEILMAFDARLPLRPSRPLTRESVLELFIGTERVRYPRLRFVEDDEYPADLATAVAGVNAIARLYHGIGAPALAHLRLG